MLMIIVFLRSGLPKFAAARPPHKGPSSATLLGPRPQNAIHIVVWAAPSLEIRPERCLKKGLPWPPRGERFEGRVPLGGPLKGLKGVQKGLWLAFEDLRRPVRAF